KGLQAIADVRAGRGVRVELVAEELGDVLGGSLALAGPVVDQGLFATVGQPLALRHAFGHNEVDVVDDGLLEALQADVHVDLGLASTLAALHLVALDLDLPLELFARAVVFDVAPAADFLQQQAAAGRLVGCVTNVLTDRGRNASVNVGGTHELHTSGGLKQPFGYVLKLRPKLL